MKFNNDNLFYFYFYNFFYFFVLGFSFQSALQLNSELNFKVVEEKISILLYKLKNI